MNWTKQPQPSPELSGWNLTINNTEPCMRTFNPDNRWRRSRAVLMLCCALTAPLAAQPFRFTDVTLQTGIAFVHNNGFCGAYYIAESVTAGLALFDYDLDGDIDIYVITAPFQEDQTEPSRRNALCRNDGQWRFTDVTATAGVGAPRFAMGVAVADYDNDGDVGIVVLNSGAAPILLRNDTESKDHWPQVDLKGTQTNRDEVGAQIGMYADDLLLVDQVHSGRGYQSYYGTWLYFGLGDQTQTDRIELAWIRGNTDVYHQIKTDQRIVLVEGQPQFTTLD